MTKSWTNSDLSNANYKKFWECLKYFDVLNFDKPDRLSNPGLFFIIVFIGMLINFGIAGWANRFSSANRWASVSALIIFIALLIAVVTAPTWFRIFAQGYLGTVLLAGMTVLQWWGMMETLDTNECGWLYFEVLAILSITLFLWTTTCGIYKLAKE